MKMQNKSGLSKRRLYAVMFAVVGTGILTLLAIYELNSFMSELKAYIYFANSHQEVLNVNSVSADEKISTSFLMWVLKHSLLTIALAASFSGVIFYSVLFWKGFLNKKENQKGQVDLVTNWKNYNQFELDAEKCLKERKNQEYAVVTFDIDQFKLVNEQYGKKTGDEILAAISDKLQCFIEKKEYFSRYSADQFVLLLKYDVQEEFNQRLERLNKQFLQELEVKSVRFSFGVYAISNYTCSFMQMSTYATIARDTVKSCHENKIAYYNGEVRNAMLREKELENNMEAALINQEFYIVLQPKYVANGERIIGAEALARWNSAALGAISPGEFIPIFEKNQFIFRLDMYMLQKVCEQQRRWLDEKKKIITISVNISRVLLNDRGLAEKIKDLVDSYEIPHNFIEIELTESAFFDDDGSLFNTVKKLRQYGFLVSMDDFGAGYSSLLSLKEISLDIVKMDAQFFRNSEHDQRSQIIIRDTIMMAKHLDMKTVAEGIETEYQAKFLEELGCDYIQGFYYGRPMMVEDFEKLLYQE
ncbi:putative bifunctional diguanylate cyclase/phosphodiesterase [Anaeromicropila populeti]|uniref:Diguanylate cyclase (GGDEF) domain-containing protein n=1 Tax=Anaeromicropila populeti TaxID=37658 RepID=A0A1I6HMQ7_9FIRM|nr:bifunctional diguanylate cyclase/phosphodiesterase [Anaeromicropila populeti]SFR55678.1 diguanylate cyclase (GGDEF) domain-containing protein [Anaeromicropila populeti]